MKRKLFAALALILPVSLHAQTAATAQAAAPAAAPTAAVDYGTATPIGGDWVYTTTADGSEATFNNATSQPQITVRCTRATRRVSLAKAAGAAAPFMSIWTSTQTKNAPASFNPATNRLTTDFGAYDPFLDAIAFSRGRVAFSVGSAPALVVPTWSEVPRVIEDCRV